MSGDLSRAVLQALQPLPLVSTFTVCAEALDHADRRCAELRAWIDKQHFESNLRYEYLEWVEFCEKHNHEAREELETGARAKAHEKWKQEMEADHKRASVIAVGLPKPPR